MGELKFSGKTCLARNAHIKQDKVSHMVGVAEYMRERADDYGIDGNVAYTAGLLHDIGYLEGGFGHETVGAEILEACGMSGDVVYAVAYHGTTLYDMGKENVTPLLVLMGEADLSVDMYGKRGTFSARLADIESRRGKDSEAYKGCAANVAFVKEYCEEHGIPNHNKVIKFKDIDGYNHGSGRYIGASTKAELWEAHEKAEAEKESVPHELG